MYSKTKLERVLELHRGYDLPERERKEGNVPITVHLVIQGYITIANAMERMLLLVDTEL